MKRSWWLRLSVVLVLLAAVAASLVLLPVNDYLQQLLGWVRGLGPWGPALLVSAYIVATVFVVPGTLLTLGAGLAFGVVVGVLSVSIGSTLGATAAFLVGRFLARDWVEDLVTGNLRFRALDDAIRQQGFKIVLLTRLSPAFPYNLLNYALSLTSITLRDYVLATWLGMLPAITMYVYLGSTLEELADWASGRAQGGSAQKAFFAAGLLATVVVTVFVTRLANRALRQAVPAADDAPLPVPRDADEPGE